MQHVSSLQITQWRSFTCCRFAVAWYPVYRIPDAPLAAKFLTFHSLLPVPARNTYFGAEETVDDASTAASAVPSPPCLPILGLKCAEQRGEPWLDGFGRFPGGSKSDWDVSVLFLSDFPCNIA